MAEVPITLYKSYSDESSSTWQPVSSVLDSTVTAPQNTLRLVTWNVWYEAVEQETRFSGFIKEISVIPGPQVDIIALQEVTPQFLHWLQSSDHIQSDWLLTDRWDKSHEAGIPNNWYGIMFLVRKKWAGSVRGWAKRFPTSKQGRFVEMVEIFHDNTSLV
jgi:hypothetical protein